MNMSYEVYLILKELVHNCTGTDDMGNLQSVKAFFAHGEKSLGIYNIERIKNQLEEYENNAKRVVWQLEKGKK